MTTRTKFANGVEVIEAGDMSPEVAEAVRDVATSVNATIAEHMATFAKTTAIAFLAGVIVGYSMRRDAV